MKLAQLFVLACATSAWLGSVAFAQTPKPIILSKAIVAGGMPEITLDAGVTLTYELPLMWYARFEVTQWGDAGCSSPQVNWTVAGNVPRGMSVSASRYDHAVPAGPSEFRTGYDVSANAYLSGVATTPGTYVFTVQNQAVAWNSQPVECPKSDAVSCKVTVVPARPPIVRTQPRGRTVSAGESVTFSALGIPRDIYQSNLYSIKYQWRKNGVAIDGETENSLTLSNTQADAAGVYSVIISNPLASVTSDDATLVVNPAPQAPDSGGTTGSSGGTTSPQPQATAELTAISCRANVGLGGDILIPGFAVGGTGSRQILVRATGPSLTGVGNRLLTPLLKLYRAGNSSPIATNKGWSTGTNAETSALQAAFTASNLPQYPIGSGDCALLATVDAGALYTATISSADGQGGVALVEVYDVGSASARITALSCRAQVGAGDTIVIGGLIVSGTASKQMIVRALGPGIVGVSGTLAQPALAIFDSSGKKIAENIRWGTAPNVPAIVSAMAAVGLQPFAEGSADCAILASLAPGGYTIQVRGVGDTTGIALIEIYETP